MLCRIAKRYISSKRPYRTILSIIRRFYKLPFNTLLSLETERAYVTASRSNPQSVVNVVAGFDAGRPSLL